MTDQVVYDQHGELQRMLVMMGIMRESLKDINKRERPVNRPEWLARIPVRFIKKSVARPDQFIADIADPACTRLTPTEHATQLRLIDEEVQKLDAHINGLNFAIDVPDQPVWICTHRAGYGVNGFEVCEYDEKGGAGKRICWLPAKGLTELHTAIRKFNKFLCGNVLIKDIIEYNNHKAKYDPPGTQRFRADRLCAVSLKGGGGYQAIIENGTLWLTTELVQIYTIEDVIKSENVY